MATKKTTKTTTNTNAKAAAKAAPKAKTAPKANAKRKAQAAAAEDREGAATAGTAPAETPKAAPAASGAKPKISLVRAAIEVLSDREEAMSAKQLVEAAKERQLWTPGAGKTPEQTLYSAITREIKLKGENARFAAAGKGKFRLASH